MSQKLSHNFRQRPKPKDLPFTCHRTIMATSSLFAKLAIFEANISENNRHVSKDKSFIVNNAACSKKNKISARTGSTLKSAAKRTVWKEFTETTVKNTVSFVDSTGILMDKEDAEKETKECVYEDVSYSSEEDLTNVTFDVGDDTDDSPHKAEEEQEQAATNDKDEQEHKAAPSHYQERGCMVDWKAQQMAIVRLRASQNSKGLSGLSNLKISDRVKTLQESYSTLETCSVCSDSFHGGN